MIAASDPAGHRRGAFFFVIVVVVCLPPFPDQTTVSSNLCTFFF